MRWVSENEGPLPLWIDLKEYVQQRTSLLDYGAFELDPIQRDQLLKDGKAALYVDGLDEIFHAQTRSAVIEELAACAAHFPLAPVIVTSRIVG